MAYEGSPTHEWATLGGVETRKFKCEVLEEDVAGEVAKGEPRLRLVANDQGEARLLILIPPEEIGAVRKELFERGYRGGLSCVSGRGGYGTWRGYLNELEVAHIAIEMLGWQLSPEEQSLLDSVDEYGRKAPTGFTSSRLK